MQTFANSPGRAALNAPPPAQLILEVDVEMINERTFAVCIYTFKQKQENLCCHYDVLIKIHMYFRVSFKRWVTQSWGCTILFLVSPNHVPHEVSLSHEAKRRRGTSRMRNMKAVHLNMRLGEE